MKRAGIPAPGSEQGGSEMENVGKLYLITGAAGYLGKVLVEKLLTAGNRVRALVLPGDPAAGELPKGVAIAYGSVTEPSSLSDFFSGDLRSACLIHCAGAVSIATRRDPGLWLVNADGTKNIMTLCLQHGLGRVVHVSSVHAIPAKPAGQVITETSVFSPSLVKGQYSKSKAEGTKYALIAAGSGLNVSVVHPSGIIGPYDPGKADISSAVISFCRGKLRTAVSGGYDFVDVRDVADGIISCCTRGEKGECYILSGRYAHLHEIFAHLCELGYGKEPRYLPLPFVRGLAPFFELYSIMRGRALFLTPYSAYTLGSGGLFSHENASKKLNYMPRSLEETLDDTVSWLREKGLIPPANRPSISGKETYHEEKRALAALGRSDRRHIRCFRSHYPDKPV